MEETEEEEDRVRAEELVCLKSCRRPGGSGARPALVFSFSNTRAHTVA